MHPDPSAPPLSVPEFAGRFVDPAPIGGGAAGRILRVRDRWTGRTAALKVARGAEAVDSLIAEYRILSRLRHPGLLSSHDLVRDAGDVGHLFELVPAVAPGELWTAGGEAAVRAALAQSVRGLSYLHRHGLIHCDVTSANVLVWNEGSRWRARVADLGLALPATPAPIGVRGTPGYMAPEVARGEPFGSAADWYSLAATAVAWIDGSGPWDELNPTEALRRAAEGAPVPRPRRTVSAELIAWIQELGAADPEARRPPGWEVLREDPAVWGPPVLEAGKFGLRERVEAWVGEAEALNAGRVAGILVPGRTGSGRRSLCRHAARELVARGWTALWDLPLDAVRDWLDEVEGDPDPVRMARELGRRFAGRDVVILWPDRPGPMESRLLRSWLTDRQGEGGAHRTLVLRVQGLADADEDAGWLSRSFPTRVETWDGPDPEAMVRVREDLFPDEEGYGPADRSPTDTGAIPLSVLVAKRARLEGLDIPVKDRAAEDAVTAEIAGVWQQTSDACRDALAVLARCESSLSLELLGDALKWDPVTRKAVASELEARRLTRRRYEEDRPAEQIADWLVRDRVREVSAGRFSTALAGSLSEALEREPKRHRADLELAGALAAHGRIPGRYVELSLGAMLREGRFGDVLEYWCGVSGRVELSDAKYVWEAAARAARRLGRFPDEVEILRALLASDVEPGRAISLRKRLAQTLFALGDGKSAVAVCRELASFAPEGDRVWGKIEAAEIHWQTGEDEEAERLLVETRPEAIGRSDLFLKWSVCSARRFTHRNQHQETRRVLEEAEELLGRDACRLEPMFLHAWATYFIRVGRFDSALSVAREAARRAELLGRWEEYSLLASRTAVMVAETGSMREAARLELRVSSTAAAMGSTSQRFISDLTLSFLETHLGHFGSAKRRLHSCEVSARDSRAAVEVGRGLALLGAKAGLREELGRGVAILRESGIPHHVSFAHQCEAYFELSQERWDRARSLLNDVLQGLESSGHPDTVGEIRLYLAFVESRLGDDRQAREELSRAEQVLDGEMEYPRSVGHLWLVRGMLQGDGGEIARGIEQLHTVGNSGEIAFWGGYVLEHLPQGKAIAVKRRILDAVQEVSGSMDPQDREAFLQVPSIRTTLRGLQTA